MLPLLLHLAICIEQNPEELIFQIPKMGRHLSAWRTNKCIISRQILTNANKTSVGWRRFQCIPNAFCRRRDTHQKNPAQVHGATSNFVSLVKSTLSYCLATLQHIPHIHSTFDGNSTSLEDQPTSPKGFVCVFLSS